MKFIVSLLLSLSAALLIAGCGKPKTSDQEMPGQEMSGQEMTEMELDTIQEIESLFPGEIQEEMSDKIHVNANCEYPEGGETGFGIKAVLGTEQFWDRQEQIVNLLIKSKESVTEEMVDYGKQKEKRYFSAGQTERLSISTYGYLDYKNIEQYSYLSNVLYSDIRFDDYNGDVYLSNPDHAFMTKTEAWEKVLDILHRLGVEVSDNYTCYVMDYVNMEKEEAIAIARAQEYGEKVPKAKPEWTEEDNCYYFKTSVSWNDYPLLPSYVGEGIDEQNVTAIYSKDGLVALLINGYYFLESQNEFTLKSPYEVLGKVQGFLENIISDNDYYVQQISLCQKVLDIDVERQKADIVPVWECKVLVKSGDPNDDGYIQKLYYNAETLEQVR